MGSELKPEIKHAHVMANNLGFNEEALLECYDKSRQWEGRCK